MQQGLQLHPLPLLEKSSRGIFLSVSHIYKTQIIQDELVSSYCGLRTSSEFYSRNPTQWNLARRRHLPLFFLSRYRYPFLVRKRELCNALLSNFGFGRLIFVTSYYYTQRSAWRNEITSPCGEEYQKSRVMKPGKMVKPRMRAKTGKSSSQSRVASHVVCSATNAPPLEHNSSHYTSLGPRFIGFSTRSGLRPNGF